MLNPELIFAHDIRPTELTSLPVDTKFLLAYVLGNVLVDLTHFKSQTAFFTLPEKMCEVAFVEEVFCEVPQVN
jgi:hypothetical protein